MERSIRAALYLPSRSMAAGSLSLRMEDRQPVDVLIKALTTAGCRMLCPVDLAEGQEWSIDLPGIGLRPCRIGRSQHHAIACEFQEPLDFPQIEKARLAPIATGRAVPRQVPPHVRDLAVADDQGHSRLRRLLIIILAGVGAWLLFYTAARLGNALLASGF